jgi:hypothetical protein
MTMKMKAAIRMSRESMFVPPDGMCSRLQRTGHNTEPINANTSETDRTFRKKPTIGFKGVRC